MPYRGPQRPRSKRRAARSSRSCCVSPWHGRSAFFPRLGALVIARSHGDELIDHAFKRSLRSFHAIGLSASGSLAAASPDHKAGIALLRSGLAEMQAAGYLRSYFRSRARPLSKISPPTSHPNFLGSSLRITLSPSQEPKATSGKPTAISTRLEPS